jgi:hypothetical protein
MPLLFFFGYGRGRCSRVFAIMVMMIIVVIVTCAVRLVDLEKGIVFVPLGTLSR